MRLAALALLALAACSPQAQDQLARDAAKSAVTPVLAEKYPGVPLEPAVTCVIDNATAQEIGALALDSVTGPNEATVQTVAGIVQRPGTLRCLVEDGVPALLTTTLGG